MRRDQTQNDGRSKKLSRFAEELNDNSSPYKDSFGQDACNDDARGSLVGSDPKLSKDLAAASDDSAAVFSVRTQSAFSDDPVSYLKRIFKGGSPVCTTTSRLAAEGLESFYKQALHVPVPMQASLGSSKIIFVGTNHNTLAFYELVRRIQLSGKKIRAVFMEELNADEIVEKDSPQMIRDRHFVANSGEREELDFAHNLDALLKSDMAEHMQRESRPYLKEEAKTAEYFMSFLESLNAKATKIGAIDHSRYRSMPMGRYNYHRHSQMNYFAAQVISSYVRKSQSFLADGDDSIILVSIGNAHNINNFKSITTQDGGKIGIRSVHDLTQILLPDVPMTSVSMLVNEVATRQFDSRRAAAASSAVKSYDGSVRVKCSEEEEGVLFSSQYLMAKATNRDLMGAMAELSHLIVDKQLATRER
jgi:hypothetical protein